ncbi:MAG TPA: vWA domain-containing protein [Dehalococcoidia bacterium]
MRLLPLAMAIAILSLAASAFAADPLRVEILSVQEQQGKINASIAVYGSDGLPLPSIPSGAVKASIDGTALGVNSVQTNTTRRQPIAVVLVVDVSGSMQGDPITQARKALTDFVGTLEPTDQVALYAFDTNVRLLQDFTSDKTAASQAVARLTPLGDTALYDAVIEASNKAMQAAADRKLVVLLTDGVATINTSKRAASLDAAHAAGASFVAIGLGADLDRAYLGDLANASSGRFLEAPTPASLKQTYANLAAAIKTQFAVAMTVPGSADRTVPAKLSITVTLNGTSATAEKAIPALAGAAAPPVTFNVNGLASGMKINSPVTLDPVIPQGLDGATVEYVVDGQSVFKAGAPPYGYQLDPAQLAKGTHLVSIVLADAKGQRGEKQISFKVVAAAASGGTPTALIAGVPIALLLLASAYIVIRRRKPSSDGYSNRIKPWRGKIPDVAGPMAQPPGEWTAQKLKAVPLPADRPLGRVILMDEANIRTGGLDAIREYEIGASPLTLGTANQCDIVVHDSEDRIGGEEARLWVQRGRLVYHKLTTLSAMATEGVTSGWQFLDSGEDLTVGPYRLAFQLDVVEPVVQPAQRKTLELWPRRPDEVEPLGASSD